MIRYYQSPVVTEAGQSRPLADVTVASKTWIAYKDDQSGIMAEVTSGQNDAIVASGGIPKTRAEIAAIYPFPAAFPSLPALSPP